jgi:hypothetical protein
MIVTDTKIGTIALMIATMIMMIIVARLGRIIIVNSTRIPTGQIITRTINQEIGEAVATDNMIMIPDMAGHIVE